MSLLATLLLATGVLHGIWALIANPIVRTGQEQKTLVHH